MSTEPDESTDTGWSHQTERSFHRVFPQVPRSEKLVDSAQCGIVKGFVRMGRIYVTPIRCSFDSPFLSCSVSVLWEDVHRMERKKQILFDALALHLRNGKVISFTAFLPGCLTKILQLSMALCAIRQRHDVDQNDESSTSSEDWDNLDISEAPFSCSDSQSISARSSAGRSRSQSPAMEENGNFSQLSPPEELDERSITSTPKSALYDENVFSGNGKAKDSDSEVPSQPSRKRSLADLSVTRKLGDCAEVRISFPQLPLDETVIASFQCNYVKGVHRPGKLFVTERSVLFASSMIPENIQITFDEVKSVQKEQTMIILAGICVKLSAGNSLRFTSFLSRDAAFNTISSSFRKFCCKTSVTKALAATSITHFVTHTCSCDESAIPSASSRGDFSSVDTEHGSAFSDASCFTKELFRDPVRFPVGRTVLDIFGSCFDDETAVLHKYHALRKDVDQHWGKWLPTKDGGGFRGQRVFTCTTHVKALMGKACPFTEFQRYAFLNIRGSLTLLVQFSSQVSGVLFSDTFRAESLIVFSQSGSNSQSEVTMQAYGYVQFLKSTWMKGRINSNTLSELSESFSLLESLLMERVQIMATQQCNFEDTVDDEGTCEVSTTDSLSTCTPYFSHPFLNVATEWRAVNMILLVWSFFLLVLALYGVMSHGVVFKNYGEESPVVDLLSNFCTTVCSIGVYISVQFIASLAASMS